MALNTRELVATIPASTVWVVFCVGLLVGFDGEMSMVVISLLCLYAYASVMLWKTVFSRRLAPLELTFWLFHTNFLLLPALSQSLNRTFYWSSYTAYEQSSLLFACFLIFIGLISFDIGTTIGRTKSKYAKPRRLVAKFMHRSVEETWIARTVSLMTLIGLGLFISAFGVDFFLSGRTVKLEQVGSLVGLGLLISLPRAIAVAVLLYTIALLMQRWWRKKNISFANILLVLSALLLNSIINYPLSVPRFWIFGFLISFMWIVFPLRRHIHRGAFVAGMTILQFTILPWYSQISRGKGQVDIGIQSFREYMRHGDFDGFQSIVNIAIYIQESGFELGRNMASIVLFFIPRTLWDKAEPLGPAAAEFMGYSFTNLSAPIYAELYADFGFLTLVAGMMLFGYGVKRCDVFYDTMIRVKKINVGGLFAAVLAGYMIILLRGSLLGVIANIATLFGMLTILSLTSKRSNIEMLQDKYTINE